mmetsp:Transcript_10574/g.42685  ORF Transcript_10574/g.42685 Transcript_10574/m.42685 type:complete len:2274 (-) Transcript_10574:246-7067(-)
MFGGFTRTKKKKDEIVEVPPPPEDKDSRWDLNEDGKLDSKEMAHLGRADAGKLERYLEADVDGDGVLSNNELRLAEEGEDQFARLKTLRKIKEAYVYRRNKKRDYMSLFLFSVFLGLYLGILYEQTQAESAYGIVWTMQNSIVPQNENTDEDQLVYSSKDNVFEWIKGTFAPIWADPKCGDGECSRQTEYPGFGKFGCIADCGPYPAEFLSTLHIDIQPSYKVDETDAVMSDLGDKFLSESSWNLCTKQLEKDDKTGAAVESCWYALEQKFRARAGRTERSIISPGVPGMDWYVKLKTPYGGTRGTVYVVDTSTTPYKRTPVYAWDYCSHTWATKEPKIIAEEAGAPAGFIFNMYKHSEDTLISPPAPAPPSPPPPPPPLPPMPFGLKASLSLKGYTKATFGLDEQLAFRESVASLLGGANFRRDRIVITAVEDVAASSGRRLLRRLLQTSYEVKITFTVALVSSGDETAMATNITSRVLGDADAFIKKMNASGATNVSVPSGGKFELNNEGVLAPPPPSPAPPPTPPRPAKNTNCTWSSLQYLKQSGLPLDTQLGDEAGQCEDTDLDPNGIQNGTSCNLKCALGDPDPSGALNAVPTVDCDEGKPEVSGVCHYCAFGGDGGSEPGNFGWDCTTDSDDSTVVESCVIDSGGPRCVDSSDSDQSNGYTCSTPHDGDTGDACNQCLSNGHTGLDPDGTACKGTCSPGDESDPCYKGYVPSGHTGRKLLGPGPTSSYYGDYGGGGHYDGGGNYGGSSTGDTFGSWGPSSSDEPELLGGGPASSVKYDSPTSKVFLGSKSKTCASGEKKYLLLSHIDQMANEHRYKVWVTDYNAGTSFSDPDSPLYSGDGWANNVDFMNGYDLETDTSNYGASKAATKIYAKTPRYSNDGVEGEAEYRYDVFPNAVEFCVPSGTTKVTMVINVITDGYGVNNQATFGEDRADRISNREFIPSFEIIDEDGCFAAPASGEACATIYNPANAWDQSKQKSGAGANNHLFQFCPKWHSSYALAEGSRTVTVDLRQSGNACNKLSDLQDISDPSNAKFLPEVALMEAIEEGYGETGKFELFSKLITDKKDGVACPATFEEIHLLIESPDATLDTFSYGIIAEEDYGGDATSGTGKYTNARMSGGTLLSPERYLTSSTGAEHTAKFPMRIDGAVAFDCVQDVSNTAPTVKSSYDDNVAYGVFNYEVAYKQANLLYMTEVPKYLRGRCAYKGKKPKLEVVKKCVKTGQDYKLHVFRAEYYVQANSSSTDSKIFITDKNGCEIAVNATATVPKRAEDRFEPATAASNSFAVSQIAGSYKIDPETGIDNCPAGRKKIYAPTFAEKATGTKDGTVKATCPSGKKLVEVVTQNSWDGAKNAWTVQHVVFNDTELLKGTKYTAAILSEATTFMFREQSVDNALQIDFWCLHPGNYSIKLTDSSVQSSTKDEGWRGGGVLVTDQNDCEIYNEKPTKKVPDASYFVVKSTTSTTCSKKSYNKTQGFCTYDLDVMGKLCNTKDTRSASADADGKKCLASVCANPKCHTPMFLQDKTYLRTKDDLLKGCCKHYSNALGDTLTGFPVPKPANATPPIPIVETVRKRFVATKNVIIGGLLLHQTRFAQEACTGKFGKNISGDVCPSSVKTASAPFGVDPTFVVGSQVYDAATQSMLCCRPEDGAVLNATNASSPPAAPAAGLNDDADDDVGADDGAFAVKAGAFYKKSELNEKGIPLGFYHKSLGSRADGFSVLIDVNLRESQFNKVVSYLEDGFYLDKYTKELTAELLTYNSMGRYFAYTKITFKFSEGGNIIVRYSIDLAKPQPYWYAPGDAQGEQEHYGRIIAESVFCLLVLATAWGELMEVVSIVWKTGSAKQYFSSAWNYIDLVSIALHITCVALWIAQLVALREFDTEARYDAYKDITQDARMLELKDGGSHLENFVTNVVDSFDAIIQIQGAYATMNGINIFLCLLRFLKYCDFQPRMGVVTRTLSLAFQDLAHFIALLLIILFLYATMGTIVFGSKIEQFSTYIRSLRTVFTWSVLGDDVGVGDELWDIDNLGNMALVGILYYMTFSVLMIVILLNFMIAILSEAYGEVQQASSETSSFVNEVATLISKYFKAKFSGGAILTDAAALKRIKGMIAAEERERQKFKKMYGMRDVANTGVGRSFTRDPNDSDYSDEDDVIDKDGMVSFVGVEDDDINVDELRRVLEHGKAASRVAVGDGVTKAKSGLGDTGPLFDSIITSIGERMEKRKLSDQEKKVNEIHSLALLMYKQQQDMMKDMDQLRGRVSAQEQKTQGAPKM